MSNLITLEQYKLLQGINSSQNDDKLESILTSVSALVRTYCGNEFDTYASTPYTEIFDIQWDTYVVQLDHSPIIEIVNVYERYTQSADYVELFRDGTNNKYDWYLDDVTDSIIRTTEAGGYYNWPKGVGSVKVVYKAGYATTPADLELAVSDLVSYYHKSSWKERQSIGSASREGAGSSSVANDPGFPDHIRRVLDMYRDV